jgi:hypothetical protein
VFEVVWVFGIAVHGNAIFRPRRGGKQQRHDDEKLQHLHKVLNLLNPIFSHGF